MGILRQHLVSGHTRMELHFKNLQVKKNTTYVLEFDILGGETDIYILPKCVIPGDGGLLHVPFSKAWTHTRFTFTTTDNERALPSFADWGICFIKTIIEQNPYNCVYSDSYIDNVQLYPKYDPQHQLIDGGNFTVKKDSPVYDRQWRPSFFSNQGASLNVDIVTDPHNKRNRCLRLPSSLTHCEHPLSAPFLVETFGWWKQLTRPVEVIEFIGKPYHYFILVKSGQVDISTADTVYSATGSMLVYLPPHSPYQFTCHTGDGTEYYWITFADTDNLRSVLQTIGVQNTAPTVLHDLSILTAHIEAMLLLPQNMQTYAHAVCGYGIAWIGELERRLLAHKHSSAHSGLIETIATQIRHYPTNVNHRSNAFLAASCGLSQNYFIRLFKEIIGMSPQQYRTQALIKRACTLLQVSSYSIKEIATELGFDDPLYFSRVFRLEHGISPREYRKQWQEQWGE